MTGSIMVRIFITYVQKASVVKWFLLTSSLPCTRFQVSVLSLLYSEGTILSQKQLESVLCNFSLLYQYLSCRYYNMKAFLFVVASCLATFTYHMKSRYGVSSVFSH